MSGLHCYIAAKCQLEDLKVSELSAFLMHINSCASIWLSKDHFSNCRAGCQFASTYGRRELDQYIQSPHTAFRLRFYSPLSASIVPAIALLLCCHPSVFLFLLPFIANCNSRPSPRLQRPLGAVT